jgi:hypothetical protein
MVQGVLTNEMLDLVLRILLIPVVILLGILLYRINRIITHGEHSLQSVENTARNVEESTKTVTDLVELLRKLPLMKKGEKDDE